MNKNEKYMKQAIKEAQKAELIDEVPIGCVIVKDDRIIARGHNVRENKNSPIGHAEIEAIRKAAKKLNAWRLEDCDIYITLEPCIMCSGAIIQARMRSVYFGAYDPKGGALGSSIDVTKAANINHKIEIHGGILQEECAKLLTDYFRKKRDK